MQHDNLPRSLMVSYFVLVSFHASSNFEIELCIKMQVVGIKIICAFAVVLQSDLFNLKDSVIFCVSCNQIRNQITLQSLNDFVNLWIS